jgi:hypothetical protein
MKNAATKSNLMILFILLFNTLFAQKINNIKYDNIKKDTANYYYLKIDINKDGKKDDVFSSRPNMGDNLLFYVNHKRVLNTKNLSQDGGLILKSILPYNKGNYIMKIITYFPDRGDFGAIHYIAYKNNKWILSKTMYYINYWEDKINKAVECKCWVEQNLDMKNLVQSSIKYIPEEKDRNKKCDIKYK